MPWWDPAISAELSLHEAILGPPDMKVLLQVIVEPMTFDLACQPKHLEHQAGWGLGGSQKQVSPGKVVWCNAKNKGFQVDKGESGPQLCLVLPVVTSSNLSSCVKRDRSSFQGCKD